MDAEMVTFVLSLLVGVAMGLIGAMFGVGGGIVSKPAIRAMGATALESVGSTLPAMVPSAIAGVLRYQRERLVVWSAVGVVGGVGVTSAVGGALLTEVIPGEGRLLMLVVAGLIAWTALRIVVDRPVPVDPAGVAVPPPAPEPAPWRLVGTGLAAGLVSGLLGLGGGVVMVPALIRWVGFPVKPAIATSLACVGIIAVPGTITHTVVGNIDWTFALPLAIGVVPGARLGARLTILATDRTIRVTVGSVLGAIAIWTAFAEVRALL